MKKANRSAYGSLGLLLFCGALVALLTTVPTVSTNTVEAQGRRYTLRIQNDSRYDIHRLYMSSSEERNWGPDQLGRHILATDTAYTITDITPGEYDIKFVDEDGDSCVLKNVAVFKNTNWVLTTDWLTRCEGYRR
ncbi:MAG TPA: hypothetical protein VF553_16075 [Pyrinomonadaceae bacterium]|jgi:hypothetical protein